MTQVGAALVIDSARHALNAGHITRGEAIATVACFIELPAAVARHVLDVPYSPMVRYATGADLICTIEN